MSASLPLLPSDSDAPNVPQSDTTTPIKHTAAHGIDTAKAASSTPPSETATNTAHNKNKRCYYHHHYHHYYYCCCYYRALLIHTHTREHKRISTVRQLQKRGKSLFLFVNHNRVSNVRLIQLRHLCADAHMHIVCIIVAMALRARKRRRKKR